MHKAKEPFDPSSLSDRAGDALKEEILSGRLAPGQRIDLQAYSANWSISITPLRDAVKNLEKIGLVEVSSRRGVFVSSLDQKRLKEIFELRIALEPLAIRLATPAIPAEEAQQARLLYLQAQSATEEEGKQEMLLKTDLLIHDLGIGHCGNQRLNNIMDDLRDMVRWSQQTIIRHLNEPYETTLPEHIRIIEAVCARNPGAAADAMRLHLEKSYERIELFLESRSADPIQNTAKEN